MKNVKELLINRVIEELKRNKVKDVCYLISSLQQALNNNKLEDIIKDLENHDEFSINYEFSDEENYYSNGCIYIYSIGNFKDNLEKDNLEDEYDDFDCENYQYKIEFTYDQRYWGYCQCSEDMEDYEARHKCCGHGCDWTAPAFKIEKVLDLGYYSWQGDEHDYWDFEDKFNNVDEVKKEQLEKEAKIKQAKEMIEYYQKQLDKLTK